MGVLKGINVCLCHTRVARAVEAKVWLKLGLLAIYGPCLWITGIIENATNRKREVA
jgi:hypothetical protein